MADARKCAQCGAEFQPKREHARFCTPRCRIAWNRSNALEPAADGTLPWAISAMRAATDRLQAATTSEPGTAFMIVTEAVWWVTLVDATLMRYHEAAYGRLLARLSDADRKATEDTFGGLRFVRNQMVRETFAGNLICRPTDPGAQPDRVAEWTWDPTCAPDLGARTETRQDWELSRHQCYQAQLAGRPIGDSFTRATAFLRQAWAAGRPSPP